MQPKWIYKQIRLKNLEVVVTGSWEEIQDTE